MTTSLPLELTGLAVGPVSFPGAEVFFTHSHETQRETGAWSEAFPADLLGFWFVRRLPGTPVPTVCTCQAGNITTTYGD